ncbi:N-acyl-L-homoserine lactone synthetase [Sulfitobacter brevis]|uniref:acyl-homoserine-lactone synthase n=1 Tax=Sulfitobacter brevis TaxID=74348 RepID=A0A1I2BEW6_9RHOB|nr:acyl-homoserine-lactone synthase [Sulfitobacter brevis]SFE54695.1 N-acyl-L-homoserine lactone synthetase [Sulfitobacter brevis]
MGFHGLKTSQASHSSHFAAGSLAEAANSKPVEQPPAFAARIEETVVYVGNQHQHGQLYTDLLKARKAVFIDQKAWDLPHTEGMEFDQYDTPQSRSVIIHEYGRILASVRLFPTTAQCGCYTYMLKDAQRGMLPNIPEWVLHERAPVAPHVWEATRLFLLQNGSIERRSYIQRMLLRAMARTAGDNGATHVIGIVPAAFQRWNSRHGLTALPMGPKMRIGDDYNQAAIMSVAHFLNA